MLNFNSVGENTIIYLIIKVVKVYFQNKMLNLLWQSTDEFNKFDFFI